MPTLSGKWKAVSVKVDNLQNMLKAVDHLTKNAIYVGVPDSKATRTPDPDDEPGEEINNAQLAYIHNNGSPARNIPARPFMTLGVQDAQPQIVATMKKLGTLALEGKTDEVDKGMNALGLYVSSTVQKRLRAGPWVPLKVRTVMARWKQRKGPYTGWGFLKHMTPLINTGRLLKSITYVIRKS